LNGLPGVIGIDPPYQPAAKSSQWNRFDFVGTHPGQFNGELRIGRCKPPIHFLVEFPPSTTRFAL
jgi:hypothetical protein